MALTIRPGSLGMRDDAFLIQAFDSALAYLESIGSVEQWGTTPFSTKPDVVKGMTEITARSEATAAREASALSAGSSLGNLEMDENWAMVLIADSPSSTPNSATSTPPLLSDSNKPYRIPIAAIGLQLNPAPYAAHLRPLVDAKQKGERFIYLQYLIVDQSAARRGATLTKGAGGMLLKRAKHVARERGCKWIFGDCWSGNGDGLVSYYQSQGYEAVESFEVPSKHEPGRLWRGKLIRIRVDDDEDAMA